MTASARERILKFVQAIRKHPSLTLPYLELIEEELMRDAEREGGS